MPTARWDNAGRHSVAPLPTDGDRPLNSCLIPHALPPPLRRTDHNDRLESRIKGRGASSGKERVAFRSLGVPIDGFPTWTKRLPRSPAPSMRPTPEPVLISASRSSAATYVVAGGSVWSRDSVRETANRWGIWPKQSALELLRARRDPRDPRRYLGRRPVAHLRACAFDCRCVRDCARGLPAAALVVSLLYSD